MSAFGIAEFLRHYAEVRALLAYLPDVHITDDLDPAFRTSDGRLAASAVVGALEADGRVRVRLAPEAIPGRAMTWHEAAHIVQLLISTRLMADDALKSTDVIGQMVRAAFDARGAAVGSAPAYEQMASMLPEAFIGEWGGYTHPLWGDDPRVVQPNVTAWYATPAADAMRRWWLALPAWRPIPFVLPTFPIVAPTRPAEPEASMFTEEPNRYLLSVPVTRGFGVVTPSLERFGRHTGVDLALPDGAPVYAIGDGVVVVDDDDGRYDPDLPATWSGVSVQYRLHRDGALVTDAHLRFNAVVSGQQVRRGQLLGFVGSTGASTGPHLHHEVRLVTGELVDPIPYMLELQEEEEDMAYTEEDRQRDKRIEQKLDTVIHITGTLTPGVWLQRIFWAIVLGFSRLEPSLRGELRPWNAWSGVHSPANPPAYLSRTDAWSDPLA